MRRLVPIAILIALLDQLTKLLVMRWLDPDGPVTVIDGFFWLVNWGNTGAAWGLFQNSNLILAGISVVTLVAICLFHRSFQFHLRGSQVALGLISGGIVGNVVDRIRYGHVVDFLDFAIRGHHWPAFNVADSAICVGVGIYLLVTWRDEHRPPQAAASEV